MSFAPWLLWSLPPCVCNFMPTCFLHECLQWHQRCWCSCSVLASRTRTFVQESLHVLCLMLPPGQGFKVLKVVCSIPFNTNSCDLRCTRRKDKTKQDLWHCSNALISANASSEGVCLERCAARLNFTMRFQGGCDRVGAGEGAGAH